MRCLSSDSWNQQQMHRCLQKFISPVFEKVSLDLCLVCHIVFLEINKIMFLQVDPRCHIQSLHWYHESPLGESKLLKTGRNATEPYMHTIDSAFDQHQGRYYCRIENVMGINECSAFLIIRNSAMMSQQQCLVVFPLLTGLLLLWHLLQ